VLHRKGQVGKCREGVAVKIPETVKVGPFNFTITMMKTLEELGCTFYDKQEIWIRDDLSEDGARETFFHEVLHAISLVYCNDELSESHIRQMSIGLYQVLKDNNLLKKSKNKLVSEE